MLTTVLFALLTQQALRPAADSFGLVLIRGRDTVATERVMRESRTMHAEVLVPGRVRLVVSVQTDAGSCARSADVQAFSWGASASATPVRRVNVRLDGDSARVTASARGATQAAARIATGMRFVMAEESVAASALLLECARGLRAAGADTVTIPAIAFPNLRMRPLQLQWHGDSVMIVGGDTSWLHVDRAGRLSRIALGRDRLEVRRIPWTALDAITRAARVAADYTAPAGAPYRAIEVQVRVTETVVLAGTLTLPTDARGPVPALVTISGTGGQDRDSFAPIADGWRPFRQLADTLARRGIATLRLDDRGIGGSTGDHASSTERTTAADIGAAIAFLRSRSGIAGARIAVLGHSEGARVAMLVASQDSLLAAIALVSGAADTRAAMRAQALWMAEHRPTPGVSRDSVLASLNRQMDRMAATMPRDVLRWNADSLARLIRVPVGVFHGATDRQVPADQADSLGAVFRRAGHRDVTVRTLANRNHLLVHDPDGDFLRYDQLKSAALDQETLGVIAEWVIAKLRP